MHRTAYQLHNVCHQKAPYTNSLAMITWNALKYNQVKATATTAMPMILNNSSYYTQQQQRRPFSEKKQRRVNHNKDNNHIISISNKDSLDTNHLQRRAERCMNDLQKKEKLADHRSFGFVMSEAQALMLQYVIHPSITDEERTDMVDKILKMAMKAKSAKRKNPKNMYVSETLEMYSLAIEAWTKSNQEGSEKKAADLLWHILKDATLILNVKEPDSDCINSCFALVIYKLAKLEQNSSSMLERIEDIILYMQSLYKDDERFSSSKLQPNTTALNAILYAKSKLGGSKGAEAAEHILNKMVEDFKSGNTDVMPNIVSFNTVIKGWATCGNANRAGQILEWISSLNEEGIIPLQPDKISFSAVLDAWAQSGDPSAGRNALMLLERIEDSSAEESRGEAAHPDAINYSSVINALSKSGGKSSAETAESLLRRMIDCDMHPDSVAFTTCIDAWSNSGERGSASRAESIVELMESLGMSGNSQITPTTVTYNVLIKAWANSGEKNAGAKAIGILKRMKRLSEDKSWDTMPNTTTYNTVLHALARSGDIEKAEKILLHMEDSASKMNPNTITYNTFLDVLARSGDNDAPEKAIALLSKMEKLFDKGSRHVIPNTKSYNTVMNVVAKSGRDGAPKETERILSTMERAYAGENSSVQPSSVSYATVINAWGRSSNREKVPKSLEVLRRMEKAYHEGNTDAKPNVYVYNSILNACSFVIGGKNKRSQALHIAMDAMKEMRKSGDIAPDHITYGAFIKVLGRNMPPGEERDNLILYEFHRCCKDGQVGDFVLREMKKVMKENSNRLPMAGRNDNYFGIPRKIPSRWHRKVPRRMKPASK